MISVCVVGSGLAGLSAASRLKRAGYAVSVLERAEHIGGRAANQMWRGIRYSTGANIFYGFSSALRALITENGLENRMRSLPRLQARCVGEAGQWSVDIAPTAWFLASRDFSVSDKLRLVRFLAALVVSNPDSNGDDACSTLRYDMQTLRAFCRQRLGNELTERLIGIVYRSARCMSLDEISPSTFICMMRALMFNRSVMAMDGGIGAMAERLAEDLEISKGTDVRRIAQLDGRCRVEIMRAGRAETQTFDIVVVATEGSCARDLVATMSVEEKSFFSKVSYNRAIYVHILVCGTYPGGQWFLSGPQFPSISALKVSPMVHEGKEVSYVLITMAPEALECTGMDVDDPRVVLHCAKDAELILPGLQARLGEWFVQKIRAKTPLFKPGYGLAAKRFRAAQTQPGRCVFYCGDYLYQPLLGGAVLSGVRIADHVMARFPARPQPTG